MWAMYLCHPVHNVGWVSASLQMERHARCCDADARLRGGKCEVAACIGSCEEVTWSSALQGSGQRMLWCMSANVYLHGGYHYRTSPALQSLTRKSHLGTCREEEEDSQALRVMLARKQISGGS